MAYRIAAPGKPGVFYQDFDDDGEAAAGGRLLHLLQVADVQNAVVVVSRWFGGVLLGPARFGLINNTARQLLEKTGFLKAGDNSSSKQGGSKKQQKKKQ
ncbi:ribosomal protein S5 domain 2-type protein [Scenedesmus sp. NREL 46B-D3]|nr:ribosomal protein S5 domain 2-type protein [Scenedesmus sp. NREL 46B-D3]